MKDHNNKGEANGKTVGGEGCSPGFLSDIKEIYLTPSKENTEKWVEDCPKEITEAADKDKTARYAIVIRQKKSTNPEKQLETHSVVIQSPALQSALCEYVFQGYPGVVCTQSKLIFAAPFKVFVHRWENMKRLRRRRNLPDATKQEITLLYTFLEEELKDSLEAHQTYMTNRIIPWDHLWIIFEPGQPIVSGNSGGRLAAELDQGSYHDTHEGKFFLLRYWSVDWNGSSFGHVTSQTKIEEYEGFREFNSLPLYPLNTDEKEAEVRDELIARGKRFEMLAGYHYKRYSGTAITWDSMNRERKLHVSGRIVIDSASFARYSPFRSAFVQRWRKSRPIGGHKIESNGLLNANSDFSGNTLSTYQQMLCNPNVRGYSPKLNTWIEFSVDLVMDIEWKTQALESLVLPKPSKDLIVAISKSHHASGEDFDDFIEGKGQGVVILLSGRPGTGKTLTAEAVAEDMRVPLMPISVATLTGNSSIEQELVKIFDLASHWNAVLLLDECDVFLIARSPDRLQQNNLVSIFLRTLEYYKGILFMTTNRQQHIDEAFASRIHLSLEYPSLSHASRKQIWNNLLKTSIKHHELSDADVAELAQLEINGRQIKNMLRMAQLLASQDREPVQKKFIDTILSIKEQSIVPDDAPSACPPAQCSTATTEEHDFTPTGNNEPQTTGSTSTRRRSGKGSGGPPRKRRKHS